MKPAPSRQRVRPSAAEEASRHPGLIPQPPALKPSSGLAASVELARRKDLADQSHSTRAVRARRSPLRSGRLGPPPTTEQVTSTGRYWPTTRVNERMAVYQGQPRKKRLLRHRRRPFALAAGEPPLTRRADGGAHCDRKCPRWPSALTSCGPTGLRRVAQVDRASTKQDTTAPSGHRRLHTPAR